MVEDLKKEKKNLLKKLQEPEKKVGLGLQANPQQEQSTMKPVKKVPLPEPEIDEETEIKFEMEREKQAQLLNRQKMLNEKLMLAQGKQNSLTKKLYKYKQVLIREGYSELVESTKINRIQIHEQGEVYQFDEKYSRFNDEPEYSSKFSKRQHHEEVVEDVRPERPSDKSDLGRRGRNAKKPSTKKKPQTAKETNSYLRQYKSKKMLGETGNQKKMTQPKSTLRKTAKSAKNLRGTPYKKQKKKVHQSHLEGKAGKHKRRRKSTVARPEKAPLSKNRSARSHRMGSSKRAGKSNTRAKNSVGALRKPAVEGKSGGHQAKVSSGFQKMDKLQAKRLERRQKSQRSSR